MQKIELSIIIVHFKVKHILYDCLRSIEKNPPKVSYEIIVVDNDDVKTVDTHLKAFFPRVRYIPAPENLGYGKGNNLGVRVSNGKYIFILNPDTLVRPGMFDSLVNFLKQHKNVGAVSPSLYDQFGKIYKSQGTGQLNVFSGIFGLSFLNKLFPNNLFSKNYWLKDIRRDIPYQVGVVPGTAFLIEKKLFNKVGGFDKNFFLYFEESDLCKRIIEVNRELYIIPTAKLIHLWAISTPPSEKIKKIFAHSRFYYFRKHYGVLSALIVEAFARMSKELFLAGAITLIAAFLRFYRFFPNLIFNGEMGTDYLNVWGILHGTHTWLIGPRTSHEWFFIPPLAYWIYMPVMLLGKYSPIAINVFWGIIGVLAIPASYYYIKKIFSEKIALISSFLIAVSPAWIAQTRASRYNLVVSILFLPYLYFLNKSLEDKGKSLFKLGILMGVMMSFFPSPLLLIPASILCFIFYKVKPEIKNIWKFILGFAIPNITFFVYEIFNKFSITIQLLTWVPYRILGFFGIYHKNTVDSTILNQNATSIFKFISNTFFVTSNIISIILFALVIIGTVYFGWKNYSLKTKEKSFYILLINFIVCYLGLFIHGNPPEHYYYTIYAVPVILVAYFIDKLLKNKYASIVATLFIGSACVFGLLKSGWFYTDTKPIDYKINPVPYITQVKITDAIIKDSQGEAFALGRVGVNDQFENNFANNYVYLLKLKDTVPDSSANIKYTIVEDDDSETSNLGKKFFSEDNVSIYKLQK